jgi:CheY-like chemotaxis protein
MPRSILVVDDDRDIREAIGTILSEEGYEVRTASNGLEALRLMGDRAPDLLLLDLMMPVMDGWQVMRVLRADAHLCSVPVVVLSALSAPECVDYIQKPISLDKLIQLVDAVHAKAPSDPSDMN